MEQVRGLSLARARQDGQSVGVVSVLDKTLESDTFNPMNDSKSKIGITLILQIAFTLWAVFLTIGLFLTLNFNPATIGQFGDFFGVFNCLLSSLAVAGAIYAVVLQQGEGAAARKREIRNQKDLEHKRLFDARIARIQAYSYLMEHSRSQREQMNSISEEADKRIQEIRGNNFGQGKAYNEYESAELKRYRELYEGSMAQALIEQKNYGHFVDLLAKTVDEMEKDAFFSPQTPLPPEPAPTDPPK